MCVLETHQIIIQIMVQRYKGGYKMTRNKPLFLCLSLACFFLFTGMAYSTQIETGIPVSENAVIRDPDGCLFLIEATVDEMMESTKPFPFEELSDQFPGSTIVFHRYKDCLDFYCENPGHDHFSVMDRTK